MIISACVDLLIIAYQLASQARVSMKQSNLVAALAEALGEPLDGIGIL